MTRSGTRLTRPCTYDLCVLPWFHQLPELKDLSFQLLAHCRARRRLPHWRTFLKASARRLLSAPRTRAPRFLPNLGSLITTEARVRLHQSCWSDAELIGLLQHAAWIGAAVQKGSAWPIAFEVPLGTLRAHLAAHGSDYLTFLCLLISNFDQVYSLAGGWHVQTCSSGAVSLTLHCTCIAPYICPVLTLCHSRPSQLRNTAHLVPFPVRRSI